MKKTIIASQRRYDYFKVNKLIILIEADISKDVINTYMKCNDIPLLWRKFFLNIAKNREHMDIYCINLYNLFQRYCREWYFYNNEMDYDNNNNVNIFFG